MEHFREAAKEQRDREARQHENQVQFLQQEIHGLKQAITEHQARYVHANQDLARLTSELGAARREASQLEKVRRDLDAAREKLAAACAERDASRLEAEHARSRASETAAQLARSAEHVHSLEGQVGELEREVAGLRARSDSAEQVSAQIRDLIASVGAQSAAGAAR